ncbi:Modification methylase DpnIIA [BD1-7 clade bacterium]|uniref:site-specific DNA-methyltransferase (adenine-specific) n=1 Tax=BD1-7 clade bacterium TaxID=2029982 RepID=A0A5S9Q1U3_9GAMM|nr:Modification methylase DpnIIA [BD1-7 clade bacterium]CAA0111888.1 Modification methylase DpnIIA [BD1-7 clade bacterium]
MAKPVIPWVGGKRKLADQIFPLFPEHTCYVEPFCGAAALYFMKEPSKVEVINDVNGDVVNLYRVVKHHLEELYKQFKWVLTSRENWHWLQATPAETLTDVQRAARFLYLQKLAFGGKVEGQSFGTATSSRPRFNIFTLEQDLADAHYRLSNTTIERLDWLEIIKRYDRPHTLFYCDPPYWETEGYGVDFPWEQYERMAELTKTIQGKIIISINAHPDIRELFNHLPVVEVDYQYTVGGASKRTDCVELIYGNWEGGKVPRPKGQSGLF